MNVPVDEKKFKKKLKESIKKIITQREEIVEAFLAKYGLDPSKMRQVVENTPTGLKWHVERIDDAPPIIIPK